ncbi:MAG: hypothetical protein WC378_11420 [Opitutaceae bacterium]|jgi:hypothetical protein
MKRTLLLLPLLACALRGSVTIVADATTSFEVSLSSPVHIGQSYQTDLTVIKIGSGSGYLRLAVFYNGGIQSVIYQGYDSYSSTIALFNDFAPAGTYTLQQYIEGSAVVETINWNGTTATVQQPSPFRTISFNITNNGATARTAYVFMTEQPNIGFSPTMIGAGQTGTLTLSVESDDATHYYAAFVDVDETNEQFGGIDGLTYRNPDGTSGTYFSGLVPQSGTATATQTALNGTATTSFPSGASYGSPSVSSGTIGTATTISGNGNSATNQQLADLGNSINATAVGVGKALNQSLIDLRGSSERSANGIEGVKSDTSAIRGVLEGGAGFSVQNELSQASSAANAAAKYTGAKPGSTDVPEVGTSASGNLNFGTITVGTREIAFSLDSAGFEGADSVLRGGRTVILWALVVWFVGSCSRTLDIYLVGLGTADSGGNVVGVENLVPGVAQGKAWGGAGIAVAGVMTAAGAMVAILDTWASSKGYGISGLMNGGDLSGVGPALGLLDRYIPVAAFAQLGIMRAAFSFLVAPVYLVAVTVVKFAKA